MSPPQLIPPTSPDQISAGDERLRPGVRPRPWSAPDAECLQRLNAGGGPCRGHSVFPFQEDMKCRNSLSKIVEAFRIRLPETLNGRDKVLPI